MVRAVMGADAGVGVEHRRAGQIARTQQRDAARGGVGARAELAELAREARGGGCGIGQDAAESFAAAR